MNGTRARSRGSRRGAALLLVITTIAVLTALGVDHEVKEYPDAGHAFFNDHHSAGDPNPFIFVVMGRFAGTSGYHQPSAQDARRRIISFFRTHLA